MDCFWQLNNWKGMTMVGLGIVSKKNNFLDWGFAKVFFNFQNWSLIHLSLANCDWQHLKSITAIEMYLYIYQVKLNFTKSLLLQTLSCSHGENKWTCSSNLSLIIIIIIIQRINSQNSEFHQFQNKELESIPKIQTAQINGHGHSYFKNKVDRHIDTICHFCLEHANELVGKLKVTSSYLSQLFFLLGEYIQVHLNKLECRGKVHLFQ